MDRALPCFDRASRALYCTGAVAGAGASAGEASGGGFCLAAAAAAAASFLRRRAALRAAWPAIQPPTAPTTAWWPAKWPATPPATAPVKQPTACAGAVGVVRATAKIAAAPRAVAAENEFVIFTGFPFKETLALSGCWTSVTAFAIWRQRRNSARGRSPTSGPIRAISGADDVLAPALGCLIEHKSIAFQRIGAYK